MKEQEKNQKFFTGLFPKPSPAGIDYGQGQTNIDNENGIRFGVISFHAILQAWADDAEAVYTLDHDPTNCDQIEDDNYDDPFYWQYNKEGYKAFQDTDDTDIFITKSPFYTLCAFCSPCAPGAGDLSHPIPDGVKTYCFGKDWFIDEPCPYPVYSVETGELVD
jgi:hypothetical protein